jgi:hypothetical protein
MVELKNGAPKNEAKDSSSLRLQLCPLSLLQEFVQEFVPCCGGKKGQISRGATNLRGKLVKHWSERYANRATHCTVAIVQDACLLRYPGKHELKL